MKMIALVLTLGLLSFQAWAQPVPGQTPVEKSPRLELFERSTNFCKAMTLTSQDLSENLFRARSGTLSETCECAAMLAVSQLSEEGVAEVLTGAVQAYAAALPTHISRCIQAGGMR